MRVAICNLVLVSKYENVHIIISISSRQVRARKIILNLVSKNCIFSREWEWDSKSKKMRMDDEWIFGITMLKLQAFSLAALEMILGNIFVKVTSMMEHPDRYIINIRVCLLFYFVHWDQLVTLSVTQNSEAVQTWIQGKMATFRIPVLVSKTEITSREFSFSSRSLRMKKIDLNLVSMPEIGGNFFSVSSRSLRVSVRNSRSRLDERDWIGETLILVSRLKKRLSLTTVLKTIRGHRSQQGVIWYVSVWN